MDQSNRSSVACVIGKVTDPGNVKLAEVEQFLYEDAALLDGWRYDEWVKLFTDDATYEVPAIDRPTGDPAKALAIVRDNYFRIRARARQLHEGRVLGESPRSRTRRMVSNVRIDQTGDTVAVQANFAIYRLRGDLQELYVGEYDHRLVVKDGVLKMRTRRSILDNELRPHGKLTIIL